MMQTIRNALAGWLEQLARLVRGGGAGTLGAGGPGPVNPPPPPPTERQ